MSVYGKQLAEAITEYLAEPTKENWMYAIKLLLIAPVFQPESSSGKTLSGKEKDRDDSFTRSGGDRG